METIVNGSLVRLTITVVLAIVVASCSGTETATSTTSAVTSKSVTQPDTTDPSTTVPEPSPPAFDPTADHLILAPVPPRPDDKPDIPLPDGSADYMDLFGPAGEDTLSMITGFKIHGWMVKHYLTADQLVTIDAALQAAGVPLIVEAEPLNPPDTSRCSHSESFEGPEELKSLRHLRDLGVHVAAIAIEQPHTFAVLNNGPGACHYTVEETLAEIGDWIDAAKAIYPEVVVGSIEGLWPQFDQPGRDYAAWLDGWQDFFGEPLPFIHVDVDWTRPDWVEVVNDIESEADARGVPFGILYNGTLGSSQTSEDWLALTARRIAEYQTVGGGTPEHVNLQSWVDLPDQVLPADDPAAFAHLLPMYRGTQADVSDLAIETEGDSRYLTGHIVDQAGSSVSGQRVSVGVIPRDGSPTTASLRGVVPDFATDALVLVRGHVEGALAGDTDVHIHEVSFTEDGGPNLVPNGDFSAGAKSWPSYGSPAGDVAFERDPAGGWLMRVVASADQQVFVDGDQFAVTAGASYEFTVTFGGSDESIGTIGVAVAFVSNGEGARETILFDPVPLSLGWTESADDGTFRIPMPTEPGSYQVVVSVVGDATTWPVTRTQLLEG